MYIAANHSKTLYVGMTNNLERRMLEHKSGSGSSFTKRYKINQLVYFEDTYSVLAAIEREKQIKGWTRMKKMQLIESQNPEWRDLSKN